MLSIVLAIILGVGFTILASQNPTTVTLSFFDTAFTLPLYLFGAFSFLLGIFISSIFHILDFAGIEIDKSKYESQVRNVSRTNESLQYQLQKAVTENETLRNELAQTRGTLRNEKVEHVKNNIRGFFGRLRQSIT